MFVLKVIILVIIVINIYKTSTQSYVLWRTRFLSLLPNPFMHKCVFVCVFIKS